MYFYIQNSEVKIHQQVHQDIVNHDCKSLYKLPLIFTTSVCIDMIKVVYFTALSSLSDRCDVALFE